jgi:putative transposase
MCELITEHRQGFGVAPICRALTFLGVPIAPRTSFAHVARSPSKRALWDMSIHEILARLLHAG